MSDTEAHGGAGNQDLGAPITELARLRVKPAAGWIHRIRARINRKILMADSLDFCFQALSRTFMVYLGSLMQIFSNQNTDQKRSR